MAQIRITIPESWPRAARSKRLDEFKVALTLVRSCADITTVANAFGGETLRNDTLTAYDLPVGLRDDLNGKPVGRPSEIFGEGGVYSVVLRCA